MATLADYSTQPEKRCKIHYDYKKQQNIQKPKLSELQFSIDKWMQ